MQCDILDRRHAVGPAAEQAKQPLESEANRGQTTLDLVELLLKQPARVDELNRHRRWQRESFPRFVLISEASYLVYSFMMVLLLNLTPAGRGPWPIPLPAASWNDGSGLGLILAYTLGILLSACVCLPAFYFYSLLAGLKLSWLQITSLVGKGTASNAILLLGILPVYVAIVLGLIIFPAPSHVVQWALVIGLLLPLVAGLWGLRAIYQGVLDLGAQLPEAWQCRRRCFLRRLVVSWTAVYAAVVPVMIHRLWQAFA